MPIIDVSPRASKALFGDVRRGLERSHGRDGRPRSPTTTPLGPCTDAAAAVAAAAAAAAVAAR